MAWELPIRKQGTVAVQLGLVCSKFINSPALFKTPWEKEDKRGDRGRCRVLGGRASPKNQPSQAGLGEHPFLPRLLSPEPSPRQAELPALAPPPLPSPAALPPPPQ